MKKDSIVLLTVVCLLFIYSNPAPAVAGGNFHQRFFCKNKVKVMTRNLYLGADIFKVLAAAQNPDPSLGGLGVPIAVAELFQTVQYTNFPERAEAIAREIGLVDSNDDLMLTSDELNELSDEELKEILDENCL